MKSVSCLLSAILLSVTGNSLAEETSGKIAPGTPWETPWFAVDSGVAGPTFLLTGGVHGDEPAGALAAEQIRHWPLKKGKLIVIPRVNQLALAAKTRRLPDLKDGGGDLNRHFPKTGGPEETLSPLAAALWEFAKELKPDWHIDLHEGKSIHRTKASSVGSSLIFRSGQLTDPFFAHALAAVNASIDDPARLFVALSRGGPIDGSFARATNERLGATTAILETTSSAYPTAVRVRQHRLMVHRILTNLEMITARPDDLVFKTPNDSRIAVAVYAGPGVFGTGPDALTTTLASHPDQFIGRIIGPAEVKNGGINQFDVVIFPGGSGSKQGLGIGEDGREQIRKFITFGGGYLGICAGCYLACENYDWSLKILDARTKSQKWRRGITDLKLEFDKGVFPSLGLTSSAAVVKYANGPVMEAAHSPDIPDFSTLAFFKSEIAENGTSPGIQIDSPAILTGPFGYGRVVGISPHPEQTESLRQIIPKLIEWSAGRNLTGFSQ
jgi:hypothetical protein